MLENTSKLKFNELFSKYCEDNRHTLSGVSVIATITALFLNLDFEKFGNSLKDIQVLLLVFLTISCFYLSLSTFLWIIKNYDSWLGSAVCSLSLFIPFYLIKFILENFREEFGHTMYLIWISVYIAMLVFLQQKGNEFELIISKKTGIKSFFIYPIINFITIYVALILIDIYLKFAKNETIYLYNIAIEKITSPLIYFILILSIVGEIQRIYLKPKISKRNFTIIFTVTFVIFIIAYFILYLK